MTGPTSTGTRYQNKGRNVWCRHISLGIQTMRANSPRL